MKMKWKSAIAITSLLLIPISIQYHQQNNKVATYPFDSKRNLKVMNRMLSQLTWINKAKAQSSLPYNSINNIRNSIGLAIGYHDNTAYGELACNGSIPASNTDCNNAPPYNGIVGRLTDIINTLPDIGKSAGITSCDKVPTSGSVTGKDNDGNSVTVYFKQPTHQIPSSWESGGSTFQKRVEFSQTVVGDPTRIAYEFNCGDNATSYVAITMDMGDRGGLTYQRRITVYNGAINANKKGIEVYMSEYNIAQSRARAVDAIRIEYVPTTLEFNLWGVMNTNISGGQLVTRSVMHGNYNTGKTSVLYSGYQGATLSGNDGAVDPSQYQGAFATATGLSDGSGSSPTDYDFMTDLSNHNGSVYKRGCIDFSSPTTASVDANECSGLALSAPSSAPYVDSNGSFSLDWAINTMPSKLEVIQ